MNWITENNFIIPSGRTSGEVQTTCPKCSHTRKKKTDKCLSINLDKKTWFCHHCSHKGAYFEPEYTDITYVKPEFRNNTNLSDRLVKWFSERGIRQNTLIEARITEGLEFMPQKSKDCNTCQFNYFLRDELINIKYRTDDKCFKLHKGSELILYNINSVFDNDEIVIVEGEMDCLSYIEAGIKGVVSVPNGANVKNNNLSYLDRYIDWFDGKQIIIGVDNDEPGRKLRDELAFRFGVENCKWIDYGKYKDANEVLVNDGVGALIRLKSEAKDFPLEGVYSVSAFENDVYDLFKYGLKRGEVAGLGSFDDMLSFERGYLTTVTGIPGHGKSDFVDMLNLKLSLLSNWSTAYFSPENKPTKLHISKLIRKLLNKHGTSITPNEIQMCLAYLNKYFTFLQPENNYTLDTILSMVKRVKKRQGLDNFVIDAWNKLEHKYTGNESQYIGESLDKLADFCYKNNLHCFLVAHPTKMPKQKDNGKVERPNLYSISGSSNFYNKTDNGLVVYRNFEEDGKVEVDVLKVKFSHWGNVGRAMFNYDKASGRYFEKNDSESWLKVEQKEMLIPERKTVMTNNIDFDAVDDLPF
jgi:twinkle protein